MKAVGDRRRCVFLFIISGSLSRLSTLPAGVALGVPPTVDTPRWELIEKLRSRCLFRPTTKSQPEWGTENKATLTRQEPTLAVSAPLPPAPHAVVGHPMDPADWEPLLQPREGLQEKYPQQQQDSYYDPLGYLPGWGTNNDIYQAPVSNPQESNEDHAGYSFEQLNETSVGDPKPSLALCFCFQIYVPQSSPTSYFANLEERHEQYPVYCSDYGNNNSQLFMPLSLPEQHPL